ncbi:MAG: UDP-glucose 4-epimerase GalE [Burkholderiales bacterium]
MTDGAILVTGGLGYIGAHTCVALAGAGRRQLVVLDNLSNSKPSVLERIRELAPDAAIEFFRADVRDQAALDEVFQKHPIDTVLHFAGLKAVGESVEKPDEYRDNNVGGTRSLLDAMARHGVRRVVFSSSATVYGKPEKLPYTEDHPLRPENPYGENKLEIERLLRATPFCFAALRYFNPIGAHPSGRIGEDPRGIPDNLFPYITRVAIGRLPKLRVFGNDYPTPDGTGVRDYIHIMDLAAGHLSALQYLEERARSITVNLGTGRGHSVLEVVRAFERATGIAVPYEFMPRRAGDIAAYWADPSLAARELGWRAQLGLEEMCRDAWRWQSMNPAGYP